MDQGECHMTDDQKIGAFILVLLMMLAMLLVGYYDGLDQGRREIIREVIDERLGKSPQPLQQGKD
jgi:hypothetical protein